MSIHGTALVSPKAKIGEGVSIGPYSIVGPDIEIGKGTILHAHVYLDGHIVIGEDNEFYPYCVVGTPPQDLSYKNQPTKVKIGNGNTFREFVSIHRGTVKDKEVTTIGDHSLFMAYVHVGHDTIIGDHCVFANSINFGGHVKIGHRCVMGGDSSVAQLVTLGKGCYVGGASIVDRDVPPFCIALGDRARLKGVNIIGMKRQGFEKALISEIVDFYRMMEVSKLSSKAFVDREELMADFKDNEIIKEMVEVIRKSEIGIASFMS